MNAIKEYLNGLESRERNLVIVAVTMLALVIPYQFIWKPFSENLDDTNVRVKSQRNQLAIMQQQASEIKNLRGTGTVIVQPARQFLNNLINTTAKRNGLANTLNIKTDSENNLRVSMDNVPFDNVMNWLGQLISKSGIIVSKLTIDRQPTVGRINVSVYLESP